MNTDKILIISYVFPPHPGIGGRRWAKFAKYLTRKGKDVYVVCASNPEPHVSAWMNDVENNSSIHLFPVKSFYPKVLSRKPRNLIQKLLYKFWQYYTFIQFRGYHYDRSVFSGKRFIEEADKLIKAEQIKNIIVTGAPFRLTWFVTQARQKWPGVNITVDFRDPWTWEPGGDYQKLGEKELNYEKHLESDVILNADFISVPTLHMLKYLKTAYPEQESKFFMLPHAWDEDEIIIEKKVTAKVHRLVLFGTLYKDIEHEMRALAKALKAVNGEIILDIFSDSHKYKYIFKEEGAGNFVNYYPTQPSRDLFTYMKFYFAAVIINNDSDKDHISTKFIELAASSTPVIYIASNGRAAEFVIRKNLGWHLKTSEIEPFFNQLRLGLINSPMPEALSINSLSFSVVTDQLLHQIGDQKVIIEKAS
jgi:glycosyltransferase involved in cell wall biosynthesis